MIYNNSVLVLNQNFVPVNVCSARCAVTLVIVGKAEVLEWGSGIMRSPSVRVECPSVVRLLALVRMPGRHVPLTRLRRMCGVRVQTEWLSEHAAGH